MQPKDLAARIIRTLDLASSRMQPDEDKAAAEEVADAEQIRALYMTYRSSTDFLTASYLARTEVVAKIIEEANAEDT